MIKRRTLSITIAVLCVGGLGLVAWSHLSRPPVVEFPAAGRLRIDGVTVVDPRDGRLSENMTVETEAGRIVRVGPSLPVPSDPAVRRVDGAGLFVVPGYNNMHTHLLQSDDPSGVLALMLAEGVTGFRQMAGTDRMLRDRREHRLPLTISTPTLLAMPGGLITPFNGPTADDVRKEIAREKGAGADFIKVGMVPSAVFSPLLGAAREAGLHAVGHVPGGVDPVQAAREGFYSIEHLGPGALATACSTERDAMFADAAAHPLIKPPPFKFPFQDRIFMWFLTKYLPTRTISPAPQETTRLAHVLDTYSPERCAQLAASLAKYRAWQVPTLVSLGEMNGQLASQEDPIIRYMSPKSVDLRRKKIEAFSALPAEAKAVYQRAHRRNLELTKLLWDAGVPLMTGTDGGESVTPVHSLGREFDELSRAGVSPLGVLRATTINPAIFLGREKTMGVVAVGYDADLVLLSANPLDNTANMHRVVGVVRGGFYHSEADLAALRERVARGRGVLR